MQTNYRRKVESVPQHALAWDVAAIPAIIVAGTLLHFCFEWSGGRRALAVFCPINESVWEHLKMAYWPVLILTGAQFLAGAGVEQLPAARAAGFLVMSALILGLYYVTDALAPDAGMRTRLALDGIIFVVAVSAGQFCSHAMLETLGAAPLGVGLVLLLAPVAVFAVTTFMPPHTRLFEDQITGGYGIAGRM